MSKQESTLEKFIKDFVDYKIKEGVYLRLGDSIELRSTSRGGSSFLASFWANVLQHRSNYPPSQYRYSTEVIDRDDHLVLDTRDVNFKVNMSTGRIIMNGAFIYEWFANKFKRCLDNFDRNFSRSWVFQRTPTGKLTTELEDCSNDVELFPKTGKFIVAYSYNLDIYCIIIFITFAIFVKYALPLILPLLSYLLMP